MFAGFVKEAYKSNCKNKETLAINSANSVRREGRHR